MMIPIGTVTSRTPDAAAKACVASRNRNAFPDRTIRPHALRGAKLFPFGDKPCAAGKFRALPTIKGPVRSPLPLRHSKPCARSKRFPFGQRLPTEHLRTRFDTLHLLAVVRIDDPHAPEFRDFFAPRRPWPDLARFIHRPTHTLDATDRGIVVALNARHAAPRLPRFANAIIRLGGPAFLRHASPHAAFAEAAVLLARAGVRVLATQVSAADLALDFVDWGGSHTRADTLAARFDAARDRILTRARVLPPRDGWGVKVVSRGFAANVYRLCDRLTADAQLSVYSRGLSEPLTIGESGPAFGALTRVEVTARTEVLRAAAIRTLADLDSPENRSALTDAFARRLRVADSHNARRDDPAWRLVLGALRAWAIPRRGRPSPPVPSAATSALFLPAGLADVTPAGTAAGTNRRCFGCPVAADPCAPGGRTLS